MIDSVAILVFFVGCRVLGSFHRGGSPARGPLFHWYQCIHPSVTAVSRSPTCLGLHTSRYSLSVSHVCSFFLFLELFFPQFRFVFKLFCYIQYLSFRLSLSFLKNACRFTSSRSRNGTTHTQAEKTCTESQFILYGHQMSWMFSNYHSFLTRPNCGDLCKL